jgi:AcrR family transcriptional regulator
VPLTPLARTLRREPKRRATPLDAFALAREKWMRGERIDIGQIASELGVGRATVFRWVGSREQLYGEVLSEAYAQQRAYVLAQATGHGIDRVVEVVRCTLRGLLESAPLRKFIEQDPEFAIRVLTSKSSPVQSRAVALEAELLRDFLNQGQRLNPSLDADTLAYIIIRIGESFLYGDVISGRKPEIEKAVAAIRILVAAEEPHRPSTLRGRAPTRPLSRR